MSRQLRAFDSYCDFRARRFYPLAYSLKAVVAPPAVRLSQHSFSTHLRREANGNNHLTVISRYFGYGMITEDPIRNQQLDYDS